MPASAFSQSQPLFWLALFPMRRIDGDRSNGEKKRRSLGAGSLKRAFVAPLFFLFFFASDAVQGLASISWFYPLLSSRLKSWYHCTPLQRPEYSGEADHRVQLDGSILGLHHGVGVRPPRLRNGWNESFLSLGLPLWLQDVQGVSTARAPWASRYAQLLSWLLSG